MEVRDRNIVANGHNRCVFLGWLKEDMKTVVKKCVFSFCTGHAGAPLTHDKKCTAANELKLICKTADARLMLL